MAVIVGTFVAMLIGFPIVLVQITALTVNISENT